MGGMAKRSAAMFWLKTVMPAPVLDGLGHATPQFRCNRALACYPTGWKTGPTRVLETRFHKGAGNPVP